MSRVLNLTERVFESALTGEKQRLARRLPWGGTMKGSMIDASSNSSLASPRSGFLSRSSERERLRLAEVEAALKRLYDGDYGRCESCESLIDVPTLLKTPWTRHCADCIQALAA